MLFLGYNIVESMLCLKLLLKLSDRVVQIANTKIRHCIRCSLRGDLKNNGKF